MRVCPIQEHFELVGHSLSAFHGLPEDTNHMALHYKEGNMDWSTKLLKIKRIRGKGGGCIGQKYSLLFDDTK